MGMSSQAERSANGQVISMAAGSARREYCTPWVTRLGSLRGVTLGGSPGSGDSAPNNETQKPPALFHDYNRIP